MLTAATDIAAPTLLLMEVQITPLMISEYNLWFVNGEDFYLQNCYLLPADSNRGAYTRCMAPITFAHIRRHLQGEHTVSFPTLNRTSACGKWFALDADYTGSKEHLDIIAEAMKEDGLHPVRESSRRGGHLWVLCSDPIPARTSRIYLFNLLDRLGYDIRGPRGNKEGIEIFPKQESLGCEKMGNALRGPMGIHRKVMQRFWFRDAEPTIQSQFSYLRSLPRCSRALMDELTDGLDMPKDLLQAPRATTNFPVSLRDKFDIRKHTEAPRRGKDTDYFVQCPSCASGGRDNDHDNLHISFKDGRWQFWCFPGCTYADIKEACK
jgi:hypothetical protein